mgnify:CR=1 FL=1
MLFRSMAITCLSKSMNENRRLAFLLSLHQLEITDLLQDDRIPEKIETEHRLNLLHDVINRLTLIDKLLISIFNEKLMIVQGVYWSAMVVAGFPG